MKILYQICIWITRISYINLLWIGFSLVGLVVLGTIPATAAMFGVIRKWILEDQELPVFKTFWNLFKQEIIRSNILGYILLIAGGILYLDFKFINGQEGHLTFLLTFFLLPLLFFYIIILLYIFPVFVHFDMKIIQYIKWSFIIAVKHPILTLSMLVLVAIASYFMLVEIPGMFIFFGGSVNAFILMWGAIQTFTKYETMEET